MVLAWVLIWGLEGENRNRGHYRDKFFYSVFGTWHVESTFRLLDNCVNEGDQQAAWYSTEKVKLGVCRSCGYF